MNTGLFWCGTLLLACGALLHAEDTRRDGNLWREMSKTERNAYMVGFIDGIRLGERFGWWGEDIRTKKPDVAFRDRVQASVNSIEDEFMKPATTNFQLADGLTAFYEDYRNRNIMISDAAWVVLRSIAGVSAKEIETLTENLRRNSGK